MHYTERKKKLKLVVINKKINKKCQYISFNASCVLNYFIRNTFFLFQRLTVLLLSLTSDTNKYLTFMRDNLINEINYERYDRIKKECQSRRIQYRRIRKIGIRENFMAKEETPESSVSIPEHSTNDALSYGSLVYRSILIICGNIGIQ